MAILALVGGLGIFGFITFRRSIQLTQSVNEVVSVAKESRGLAKNNVLPKEIVVGSNRIAGAPETLYAYNLNFQNNQMNRRLCSRLSGSSANSWICDGATEEQLKSEAIFAQIEYVIDGATGCKDVLFENLTGDIKVRTDTGFGAGYEEAECTIEVKHELSDGSRVIVFDAVSNTYGIIDE